MTHSEFTHILHSLNGLSPEQVQRLRRELDNKLAAAHHHTDADPLLGSMADHAELMDEIVEEAMHNREHQPWRLAPVNKALLDTDTLSEIGKGKHPAIIANAKTYRRAFGHYSFSTVSVLEIVRGYQKAQQLQRLHGFMASIAIEEVFPLDTAAAELAGRITGDLDRSGQPIGRADPMIAAIAIDQGLELVTGNTAHFQRIQQLGYPLTLVSWR